MLIREQYHSDMIYLQVYNSFFMYGDYIFTSVVLYFKICKIILLVS
jgi:hypothetical protein